MFRKFSLFIIISFLVSQEDIAGTYQFSGLYAIYQNIARYDTPIMITDIHGMNITLPIDQIDAGEIYRTTYQGPYGYNTAVNLGVNINVTFNEDGTGTIDEGSVLPSDVIDTETCTVSTLFEGFSDELIYSSDLEAGLIAPSTNILGYIPNNNNDYIATSQGYVEDGIPVGYDYPLVFQGETTGSISLSQSGVFDFFPSEPVHPTLCDNYNNCFDVILENGETIPGGSPLPGFAGGWVLKGNLASIAPSENECADLYLEWHAIDGPISGQGLGDEIDTDEETEDWDGDGNPGDNTDFDRIWALQSIQVTSLDPGCGYNYPVAGDLSLYENMLGIEDVCIESNPLIEGNEFYIMDPAFSEYGNFLTFNALNQNPGDDSDHDYNGTDGRLVWHFDPMCIPDIMVRHIMLEFLEIGGEESCISSCPAAFGDMNNDGGWNVLDIVTLANCVLATNCAEIDYGCAGDINGDGGWNVLDIVTLANCVLSTNCDGLGRSDDATESRLIMKDNMVSIEADGFVGGVQMTLTHGSDFKIEMTDKALFADYLTKGNETRLLVITPETDELFIFSGDFEITEVIVANSQFEVPTSLPTAYHLSVAYPNPFNPTTTMLLTMPVSGDVNVEIYNLLGQVVVILASGYMKADTYTLTWDAAEYSSGMYFVKMTAGDIVQTQKLMLVK